MYISSKYDISLFNTHIFLYTTLFFNFPSLISIFIIAYRGPDVSGGRGTWWPRFFWGFTGWDSPRVFFFGGGGVEGSENGTYIVSFSDIYCTPRWRYVVGATPMLVCNLGTLLTQFVGEMWHEPSKGVWYSGIVPWSPKSRFDIDI